MEAQRKIHPRNYVLVEDFYRRADGEDGQPAQLQTVYSLMLPLAEKGKNFYVVSQANFSEIKAFFPQVRKFNFTKRRLVIDEDGPSYHYNIEVEEYKQTA